MIEPIQNEGGGVPHHRHRQIIHKINEIIEYLNAHNDALKEKPSEGRYGYCHKCEATIEITNGGCPVCGIGISSEKPHCTDDPLECPVLKKFATPCGIEEVIRSI